MLWPHRMLVAALCCAFAPVQAATSPRGLPSDAKLVLQASRTLSAPTDSAAKLSPTSEFTGLNLSLPATTASLLAQAKQQETSMATARGLHPLLARALARDAQVQSAQAALASAQARYRQARSRMLPTVGVQASNGRSSDLDDRQTVERHTQQVEANLRWNLYQGGADYAEMAANQAEVAAAEAELRRAKEEVTERLAEAYSDLLRLVRTRESAAARLVQVVQLVAQVAHQSEAGKLSELDLQQAQNAELDAELTSNTLESEYQSTLVRLRLLAGGELSEDLVEFSLAHTSPRDTTRNAALQVAQARATAAQLRVRTLAATLAPKIDLNVRQLLNNHTTPPQTTVQQRGWSIGVSWDMPLGGENFARRDETISRSAQAQSEVERAELAARAEFESLTPRIANLRHAVSNLTTQESKMAQLVRASNIQFEAGRRNLQQIIQSWDSYFNLQQRLHEQRHKLFLAQMRQLALAGQLLEGMGLEK